jgi:beta propeller repeat protein
MPDLHAFSLLACIAAVFALSLALSSLAADGSPITGSTLPTPGTVPAICPEPFTAGTPEGYEGLAGKDGGSRTSESMETERTTPSLRPVSPGPGNQTSPDVSGDRVVWTDDRAGNRDIYLSTAGKAARPIASSPGDEDYPSVSGVLVAYQRETGPGNTDVYLYRADTRRTIRLTGDPGRQERPSAGGGVVVWEDYREGTPVIWLYRAATGKSMKISGGEGPATRARTDGKRVVWQQEGKGGMYYVRVFDIASGKTTTVFPEEEAYTSKRLPVVSGDFVCYLDEYEPWRFSVELFDLRDGQRVPDPESSISQVSPDFSGDTVVWQQRDGGRQGVRYYRVSSKITGAVSSSGGDQELPSTDGKTIVWQEDRDGRYQVYRAAVPAASFARDSMDIKDT